MAVRSSTGAAPSATPDSWSRGPLVAAVGLLFLYAIVGLWLCPPEVFFSCDAGSKFLLARAFSQGDPGWPTLPYPGREIDPEGRFFPIQEAFAIPAVDGYWISSFPIYFPMLSSLGYTIWGTRGLLLVPLGSALAGLLLFARLGRNLGWSHRRRTAGVVLFGLATPFGFYGTCFWEHAPAAALILGGLALLTARREGGRRSLRFLAAGALLGASIVLRPECVWVTLGLLAALGIALLLTRSRPAEGPTSPPAVRHARELAAAAAGVLAIVGLLLAANQVIYGHAVGPQLAANYSGFRLPRLFILLRIIVGKSISISWLIPASLALLTGLAPARAAQWIRIALALALLAALVPVLATQTFPPGCYRSLTGVLETSPFFFLLPPLALARGRSVSLSGIFAFVAVVSTAGIALTSPVEGGSQGGSRFLLPSITFGLAAVLSAYGGSTTIPQSERWRRRLAWLTLALSVPLSSRALVHLVHETRAVRLPTLDALRNLPGEVVIFTESSAPQDLAYDFDRRPYFLAEDEAATRALLATLESAGVRSLVRVDRRRRSMPPRLIASEELPRAAPRGPQGASLVWVLTRQDNAHYCGLGVYEARPLPD